MKNKSGSPLNIWKKKNEEARNIYLTLKYKYPVTPHISPWPSKRIFKGFFLEKMFFGYEGHGLVCGVIGYHFFRTFKMIDFPNESTSFIN